MRSKAWLAAPVALRLARMPRPARATGRLLATLAAAPVIFRQLLFDTMWRKHIVLVVLHVFCMHHFTVAFYCFLCLQDALVADAGVDMLVRLMMAGGGAGTQSFNEAYCFACDGIFDLYASAYAPFMKLLLFGVCCRKRHCCDRHAAVGLTCRVRHSVAIYGQLLLFCDQSMREKAWLAVSMSLRLAHLPPLQAGYGARVAYAPRLRLRQAFSRMHILC